MQASSRSMTSTMGRDKHATIAPPQSTQWTEGPDAFEKYREREPTVYVMPRAFSAATVYRSDYTAKAAPPSRPEKAPKWRGAPPPDREFQSTHKADYKKWPSNPPADSRPVPLTCKNGKFWDQTEHRSMYLHPPLAEAAEAEPAPTAPHVRLVPPPPKSSEYRAQYTPKNADGCTPVNALVPKRMDHLRACEMLYKKSVASEAYAWPTQPGPKQSKESAGARPVPLVGPADTRTSEHRDNFVPMPISRGLELNLGVQFSTAPYKNGGVGGQFYSVITAGTQAPVEKTMTFTTVVDGQKVLDIVIVALPPGEHTGIELGYFSLEGIADARAAVPRVTVNFRLQNERTLKMTAHYQQGKITRRLMIRGKRALRKLTIVS